MTILSLFVLTIGSTSLSAKQSPFLIQGKMPHLTMLVKQNWDNEALGFTEQQRVELKKIRQRTMSGVMGLKGEILPLEKSIVKANANGEKPASLKKDVEKLAKLRAEATMIHLNCIYDTKKVLSEKQLLLLLK